MAKIVNAKVKASTQKFIEIQDIRDNIVLLSGGDACMVMQVTATNFALLSKEEQDSKMYAYASLLNSLSFPVQVLVKSKRVQITPYLRSIEQEAQQTANPKLASFIRQYKDFVEQLVTVTTVLDKQFFLIISYSALEGGIKAASGSLKKRDVQQITEFFNQAKAALHTKADSLMGLIERLSLRAKILEQDELTKLFYDIYNGTAFNGNLHDMAQTIVVKKGANQ